MPKLKKPRPDKKLVELPLVLLAIVLVWVVVQGSVLIKNHLLVFDETNLNSSSVIKPRPESKEAVKVKISGADEFLAIKEDYKKDDSLWRIASRLRPLGDQGYRPAVEFAKVASWSEKSHDERSVRPELQLPLQDMFVAAKTSGHDLMIGSGFRSAQLQATYYNNFVSTRGQDYADKVSARPGTSEHQLGLAVDLSYVDRRCYLSSCFADTPAGKWLAENAHEYGFILRYPKNKTDMTGYQFEPWHFRFVGKDLASALYQSGLTLDEAEPFLLEARRKLGY